MYKRRGLRKNSLFRRDTRLFSDILSSSCFLDRPPPTVFRTFLVTCRPSYSYYSLCVLLYLKYPGACADTLPVFSAARYTYNESHCYIYEKRIKLKEKTKFLSFFSQPGPCIIHEGPGFFQKHGQLNISSLCLLFINK